uniref:Cilia- and flagella-associated protein 58 central coiled coil domain-containing protein n=1 Tax=Trypanosoma congolense (strain IL3000) TaxID=1068625 RepID=G0UL44_TRYCI|nr:conserved hypothetical protein [Trypanosoma congolense IL3000]
MAETLQLLGDATDVSNAAAIVALDTLVEEGRLIEERADYLKDKFKELHNRVLTVYKRDFFLLKRARQLRKELDIQKERMVARGKLAQEDDAEIQRLSKLLMNTEEELSEAQERESILQVEVLEFDRKKHMVMLEREDAIAAEEAQLRPRMEAIRQEVSSMGKEVEEMTAQCQSLVTRRDALLAQEAEFKEALTKWKTSMSDASRQLTNIDKLPEHTLRQAQVIVKSYEAAQLEAKALEEKLAAQADVIAKLELKKNNRNSDYEQAAATLRKLKSQIDSKRVTLATLNSSLEMEQEAHQGYQQRIAQTKNLINTHITMIAKQTEEVEQARREVERLREEHAELDISLCNVVREQNELKDNIASIVKTIERVQTTRKRNAQRLEDAQREADRQNDAFLMEQRQEKEFAARAEDIGKDIELMKKEMKNRVAQEEVKRRELKALAFRLHDLNRERAKGKSRIIMGKHELRIKEMYVHDARKRLSDLENRLNSITDTFQSIKHERTHKAAQIQAITQKMTEMTEKKTILENELVVLCRELAVKEAELVKKRRRIHKLRQIFRALRMEKNNRQKDLENKTTEERNVKTKARRMACRITDMEDEMERMKKSYQSVIESRDCAGVQLLDRNDELCVLYERFKAQDKIIHDGVSTDNSRVEEIRALRIKLADVHREVDLVRALVPQVKELERELAKLVDEIDDERWKVEVLENDLTNPKNPHRWRLLKRQNAGRGTVSGLPAPKLPQQGTATADGGKQPEGLVAVRQNCPEEVVELQQRHQQLEERVNDLKTRIREKDLILEEVTELSARLAEQVENGRDFTLALTKQVNSHHRSIRVKTRQMMATVSELSVFQASAIQLQQDVQRLEGVVEEAERLLSQGEAPFAEAEERYAREMAVKARYKNILQRIREEESDAAAVAEGGAKLRVMQRPNAYIPDNDLGIPKPFGALMPFKPTTTPQTSRFYKMKSGRSKVSDEQKRVVRVETDFNEGFGSRDRGSLVGTNISATQ